MNRKYVYIALGILLLATINLPACSPADPIEQTVIVKETAEKEVETIVVTEIVEVTPEPEEEVTVEFKKADSTTLVKTMIDSVGTLDPVWNYETSGNEVIQNVYEPLVVINRNNPNEFVPAVAESWEISDDGGVYTFKIREGIKFHEGQDLTPEDVAYSFQRGLLQGGGFSPQWLMTEPLFGFGVYDVAALVDPALVDDPDGLAAADPEALLAACERTKAAIVSDEDAATVTFNLAQPWGPFLATISQAWGSIQDKDWAIGQGAWDGDCATWPEYYSRDAETTPLGRVMNGTGPYMLESLTFGEEFVEEVVLVRNEDYWRSEPIWEGGPSGLAAIEHVVIKYSLEQQDILIPMFQTGDADIVEVIPSNTPQVDLMVGEICDYNPDTLDFDCHVVADNEDAPFRLFQGHPGISRRDALFFFDINIEGGNQLLGSGKLDGDGIPPDFFQDIDVRRAFNYCFDWEAFIDEVMIGEAVQNTGVLIPGMIGYDPTGPQYSFDLEKCQEHIEAAWDGAVAENGFRVQIAYPSVSVRQQAVAQILQRGFGAIDPKYTIETVGLPVEPFVDHLRGRRLPISFIGSWLEDIHDPHNWAQPFTVGIYAARQTLPEDMIAGYKELVDAGVKATDPAERDAIYRELQQLDYDNAIAIRGAVPTGRHYEQRWVNGWYYNPVAPGDFFYALSIE